MYDAKSKDLENSTESYAVVNLSRIVTNMPIALEIHQVGEHISSH